MSKGKHKMTFRDKSIGLLLAMMATTTSAQDARDDTFFSGSPYITGACRVPDKLMIEDAGVSSAMVTYYNSIENCSRPVDMIMTSPNGIAARVVVVLGGDEDRRERLTVTPVDVQYAADPPEAHLLEGETVVVIIMARTS